MLVKVQKIGNSHMVTIPVEVIREAGLAAGDMLKLEKDKTKITFKRAVKAKDVKQERKLSERLPSVSIPGFDYKQAMKWKKMALYER